MSNSPVWRAAKRLRRQHKVTRDAIDQFEWKHPRPLQDPRLVCMHVAFIIMCIVQISAGASPSSVQSSTFGYVGTVVFCIPMVIASMINLYAAYCKSQYDSFGWEISGCIGFVGGFAIYVAGLAYGVVGWWGSTVTYMSVALLVGNGWRAVRLIRRLW